MSGVREQDHYMPVANVIRIMRRILPAHAKISDSAKEMIQECVTEYISFITAEANERCQKEQRKTVTAEDVLWAMEKLGFEDYAHPLAIYLKRYRDSYREINEGGDIASVRHASASASSVYAHSHAPAPPLSPVVLGIPPSVVVPPCLDPTPSYSYGFGISEFDPSRHAFYQDDASASGSGAAPAVNFLTDFDPFGNMNSR
ncbi:hypothetical protein Fmac_007302 [Flemingia macrophylla]|uniref:Transcription factor CBF/NF-Y/archaeal histone domain-containing protein n=1 Tax=Flemingia macrophylla TaxID=520843 RepID=A0ABD1MV18_9FABA